MNSFSIPVRNEVTGEVRIVRVVSGHVTDAQVSALQLLFRLEGWRKAIALPPHAGAGEQTA